ncbi:MAG: hydantoinase/oxoprolinase family protein [Pseudomonadota bacterium]
MNDAVTRVGVDIGGTFTDVVLESAGSMTTCKVLTNYAHPENAILEGIQEVCARANVDPGSINQVIHGTTLVTNALIERRGAKLAFVTTEGFRDVVEMRTENRFEQYDLNLMLPQPLVARQHRYTLNERVAADGSVLLALDDDEVSALVDTILREGYDAVAIGFMHAYANPEHEQRVEAALQAAAPDLFISISSVVSPQMRELPRFNTVIANAYVRPQIASYLGRLVDTLRGADILAPVFMVHSGGGLISLETASSEPVRLLESGPAGGAIYAADFALSHDLNQVLSFDMGGTTAKICLVESGKPKVATTFEVARTYRFKKGSGMTVSTPVVEMVEIGAGGGSLAHIDSIGQIRVGPQSAGSEPGPACYQRGGTKPAVTDANLLLGRLDPDNFAGGAIPLSVSDSSLAIDSHLAHELNMETPMAAFGVTEMVDENMANAARVHAVENGKDIEHFTMIAFGGGAPLHACRLCEKLGIRALIIPPGAGVGSAIGFLKAPFSYEASQGLFQRLNSLNVDFVNETLERLEGEAAGFVAKGIGNIETTTAVTAHMRYAGQGSEIAVVLPQSRVSNDGEAPLKALFESCYQELFGRVIEGLAIEVTNWSVTVASVLAEVEKTERYFDGQSAEGSASRPIYDAGKRDWVDAREIERKKLMPGIHLDGPAVVTEAETTTIVTSAFTVTGQGDGSLLLQRKEATTS